MGSLMANGSGLMPNVSPGKLNSKPSIYSVDGETLWSLCYLEVALKLRIDDIRIIFLHHLSELLQLCFASKKFSGPAD
jgi:hypothetical protein